MYYFVSSSNTSFYFLSLDFLIPFLIANFYQVVNSFYLGRCFSRYNNVFLSGNYLTKSPFISSLGNVLNSFNS